MSFADDDVCGGSIASRASVIVQGRCVRGGERSRNRRGGGKGMNRRRVRVS